MFVLIKSLKENKLQSLLDLANNTGLAESKLKLFKVNEYTLLHWGKVLVPDKFYVQDNDQALSITGTLIYKSQSHGDSLSSLFEDLKNDKVSYEDLLGNYSFVYIDRYGYIKIVTDPSNVQNIFYSDDYSIVSSSMLSVIYGSDRKWQINNTALTENLLTGSLLGPDTVINGLFRFEGTIIENNDWVISTYPYEIPVSNYNNRYEAIEDQIAALAIYFNKISKLAEEFGVDSGLTSGLDSRLLLSYLTRQKFKVHLHSHYRNPPDKELLIAREVAAESGFRHFENPVKKSALMTDNEFINNLDSAYYFYDGQVRMHSFWTEAYNTRQHRTIVLRDKRLGLSGIGGEQYRNMDGLISNRINLKRFIRYRVFKNICGEAFNSRDAEDTMINEYMKKVIKKLSVNPQKYVDFSFIKRYQNEAYISSRLNARNNAENNISFFLSPFIDFNVSRIAYIANPFLGWTNNFEMSMINKMSPKIAAIQSDYGYDFTTGVPIVISIRALFKELTPEWLRQKRINKILASRPSLVIDIKANNETVENAINSLKELELPIKIDKLLRISDLLPGVIGLGYFIHKLKKEGKLD